MATAAAAGALGLLWTAEDAEADDAAVAAGGHGASLLSTPARTRMHCWGLQLVSPTCAVQAVLNRCVCLLL